jgi:putative ABC transport system ATP-binding protein
MLRVNNVCKSFGQENAQTVVLDRLSLTLAQTEMVSVMGPSGCGKSTLLNLIAGIDTVDQGEIYFQDKPLHSMKEAERAALRLSHMGFVFQNYNLIPVLNATENVALPLISSGVRERDAYSKARQSLEAVGFNGKVDAMMHELSGGQMQRIAIARAIVGDPVLILADEPTGALDESSTHMVMDLLSRINRTRGVAIFIVTHDPLVAEYTERVIHLQQVTNITHLGQADQRREVR